MCMGTWCRVSSPEALSTQDYVPDLCSFRFAFRTVDVQGHNVFAGFLVLVNGMLFRQFRSIAELPGPCSDRTVRFISKGDQSSVHVEYAK